MANDNSDEVRMRLETAYHAAAANWSRWRCDYNFRGKWKNRPLLNDINRFSRFCSEYNLSRNIPGNPALTNKSEKAKLARLRRRVVMDFVRNRPIHPNGCDINDFAKELSCFANKPHESCGLIVPELPQKGSGRVSVSVSLVSKIACFSDPARFPPLDRLNRIGLGISTQNNDYAWFKTKFDETRKCKILKHIYASLNLETPSFVDVSDRDRKFWSRVVDNYLMLKSTQSLKEREHLMHG